MPVSASGAYVGLAVRPVIAAAGIGDYRTGVLDLGFAGGLLSQM